MNRGKTELNPILFASLLEDLKNAPKFKKGSIVEITSNIPSRLSDSKRPLLGTITNIDGEYILVRPKYQRWVCEFYRCELKLIK